MQLNEEKILKRADELYVKAKWEQRPSVLADQSLAEFSDYNPDCSIRSDQVKCLLKALVEAINNQQETDAQAILRRTI
jgi:hypothetical protein